MINYIDVNLDDKHCYNCETIIAGRKNENRATAIRLHLTDEMLDKNIYVEIQKADQTKLISSALTINQTTKIAIFEITNQITNVAGDICVDIVIKDSNNMDWKTFKNKYRIEDSVSASDEIEQDLIDFITQGQIVVDEANNLNLAAEKQDRTTTITITKKDGTTETQEIVDGIDGTNGVDGIDGQNATVDVGTTTTGEEGTEAQVTNSGTTQNAKFDFVIPRGTTGSTGNGINSVQKTNTVGKVDTYTITFTNGTQTTFDVTNGQDGTAIEFEVVQELPATGEAGYIYLVPKQVPGANNSYDEYIWQNNSWEKIGDTTVDLSNYYTKSQVDQTLQSYITSVALTNALNNYYTKGEIDTTLLSYITATALNSTLSNYYTKSQVDAEIDDIADGNKIRSMSQADYDTSYANNTLDPNTFYFVI